MIAFVLTACGKTDEMAISEEMTTEAPEPTEPTKPQYNIVMKDSDGNILITGDDIYGFERGRIQDSTGNDTYTVGVRFTDEGGQKFSQAKSELTGSKLFIYVDDELVSSPVIKEAITGGTAQIAELGSYEEVDEMIAKIQGTYVEETTTEASEPTTPRYNIVMKDSDGNVLITGDDIYGFERGRIQDSTGNDTYTVGVRFTDEGGQKFSQVTSELIGSKLFIYVDDELVSSPVIKEAITGGTAQIAELGSYEEVDEMIAKIQGTTEDTE